MMERQKEEEKRRDREKNNKIRNDINVVHNIGTNQTIFKPFLFLTGIFLAILNIGLRIIVNLRIENKHLSFF